MKISRLLFGVLTLALTLGACKTRQPDTLPTGGIKPLPTPVAAACPQTIDFVIMQLNDVYEIAPMDGGKVAGLARVATVRKQLQAEGNTVITVLSGDYLSPSLMGTLKCTFPNSEKQDRVNGRQMVEVMNAIGVDYVTFGNHEFDLDTVAMNQRDNESQFKIISANVLYKAPGNRPPAPFKQHGEPIPAYAVHKLGNAVGDSLRLGFIGVTLPFNLKDWLKYTDIYSSAEAAFTAARPHADVIMAITHLSILQDDTLSRRIPTIPLLMGGHEHENMVRPVGNAKIVKADANAKTVYLHWCKYHPDTKQIEIHSQLMPITNAIVGDTEVEKIVQKWEVFADNCMKAQGYLPDDTIGYAMSPLDGRDASMRTSQTNLGFLICDAMRKVAPSAEIAIMNSGSVRLDDQITGVVLQRHILATLPFGKGISEGAMKGSDLRAIMDKGLSKELDMNGAHLQYSSNFTRSGSTMYIDGKPLDDQKMYRVVMPGFLTGKAKDTGETVYNNMGIANMAAWADPDLKAAMALGLRQNDVRDIVIFAMKQDPKLKVLMALMREK